MYKVQAVPTRETSVYNKTYCKIIENNKIKNLENFQKNFEINLLNQTHDVANI